MTPSISAGDSGSSPRVRGTRLDVRRPARRARFIPACAGNSTSPAMRSTNLSVHPRVCGELCAERFAGPCPGGSSPRVRGTRNTLFRITRPLRFIPACAGNSQTAADCQTGFGGSSPRVRGTLSSGVQTALNGRFIPACAGNSNRRPADRGSSSVHPRVCGELITQRQRRNAPPRFIPACAGNSAQNRRPPPATAVHPRVCGELGCAPRPRSAFRGSSPRVRGTPPRREAAPRRSRFIPACAGNSRGGYAGACAHDGSSPRVRGTRACRRRPSASRTVHPRVCGELGILA